LEEIVILNKFKRLMLFLFISIGISVMLYLLSLRFYLRWDLTEYRLHSLTEKSSRLISKLDTPIEIIAFVRKGHENEKEVQRLLSAYRYVSSNIRYKIVDPEKRPQIAKRYGIDSYNKIVIEAQGRRQLVNILDEEHITDGIVRVWKGKKIKVAWIQGHGERPLKGSGLNTFNIIYERLKDENYDIQVLNMGDERISSDFDLIIIASPKIPFMHSEIQELERLFLNGKGILILLDPLNKTNMEEFLKRYGILVGEDMVVDKMGHLMGGDYLMPVVSRYGNHKITERFRLNTFFHMARSVEKGSPPNQWVRITPLLFTSDASWAETDLRSLLEGKVEFEEVRDRRGPICIGLICELRLPIREEDRKRTGIRGRGKLAVFGDSDFASNKYINFAANSLLIENTINYLSKRHELIFFKKRHRPIEALMLTKTQGRILFWVCIVIVPSSMLLLGVVVWLKRRAK